MGTKVEVEVEVCAGSDGARLFLSVLRANNSQTQLQIQTENLVKCVHIAIKVPSTITTRSASHVTIHFDIAIGPPNLTHLLPPTTCHAATRLSLGHLPVPVKSLCCIARTMYSLIPAPVMIPTQCQPRHLGPLDGPRKPREFSGLSDNQPIPRHSMSNGNTEPPTITITMSPPVL